MYLTKSLQSLKCCNFWISLKKCSRNESCLNVSPHLIDIKNHKRTIHIYTQCLKDGEKSNFDVNQKNIENTIKKASRTSDYKSENRSPQIQISDPNAHDFETFATAKTDPVNVTTKKSRKNLGKHSERDKDVIQLIQNVVEELNIKSEDRTIAKKVLSNRYKTIHDKLPSSTEDFETLLNEVKTSEDVDDVPSMRMYEVDVERVPSTFRINVSSGERLGIFNKEDFPKDDEVLNPDVSTWTAIDWFYHYKSLNDQRIGGDLDKHFALTDYQELIQLTEEGKLWKFPINNDDDMIEEAKVPFYKHVFLDEKLNDGDWCPKEGPIRDFMNCVITALSHNPYFTVDEKHEHIEWFRDYFNERRDTMKVLGLIQQ